jgi:hypothetical protein
LVLPLYAVTLFISAFLLFLVQPMIGRMILPALGGTPQVWNTCMMFFQTVLLAGYAYTHTVSTRLPLRRQITLHCVLIAVPLIVLFAFGPFNVAGFEPPQGSNPIFYTLFYLTLVVGLPFFVVSTTAPLLQRWFAYTGHPAGKDPYFLYGASNLGSMLAVLAYPFFVEPGLILHAQAWTWAIGYFGLVVLLAVCAKFVWKSPEAAKVGLGPEEPPADMPVPPPPVQETSTAVQSGPPPGVARSTKIKKGIKIPPKKVETAPVRRGLSAPLPPRPDVMTPWRRLRWVLLAAAPSSLMLGAITYMSTDLSPMPMFWMLPLALYLLTFILVFARYPVTWTGMPHNIMLFIQPIAVVALCAILVGWVGVSPLWRSTSFTLLGFFLTAMMCHGELARDRPSTKHLTEFFLWMSVGGMLGGVFNGLFAPLIFTGVVEYPLALVVACFMRPEQKQSGWTDNFLASSLTGLTDWFRDIGTSLSKVPLLNFMLIVLLGGAVLGGAIYLLKDMTEATNFVGTVLYWIGLIVVIMVVALRFRPQQGLSFLLDGLYPLLVFCLCGFMLYNATTNWNWLSQYPEKNALIRFLKSAGFDLNKPGFFDMVRSLYNILVFGIPLVIGLLFASRPLRYGLAVGAVLLANAVANPRDREERALYAGRTYFGVLRVYQDTEQLGRDEVKELNVSPLELKDISRTIEGQTYYFAPYRYLMHGTTHHGLNYQVPKNLRRLATTYYHSKGPTGIIMEKLKGYEDFKDYKGKGEPQNVYHSDAIMPASLVGMGPLEQLVSIWQVQPYATVGLGTGTMASYGRPFQHVTFYEIDDAVRSFHVPPYAPNGPFFNYLGDAIGRGVGVEIIMGDARQSMKQNHQGIVYLKDSGKDIRKTSMNPHREKYYRVIELDAFSSDAIPVHLITLESVKKYFDMLSEEGVLCVHTSNRHADLTIPARDIATALKDPITKLKYAYVVGKDQGRDASGYRGHFGQEYVMIARKKEYLPQPGVVKNPDNDKEYMTWSDKTPDEDKQAAIQENQERVAKGFRPGPVPKGSQEVWTDDYTNLVGILREEDIQIAWRKFGLDLGYMPPVTFLLWAVFIIIILGFGLIILVTKRYEK